MAAASESVNNAIDTIKKISLAENKKNNKDDDENAEVVSLLNKEKL